MKKCPVCGHIMEDEACFCSACGEKMPPRLGAPSQVEEIQPTDCTAPSSATKEKKKVSFKPLLIISVGLLALIAVILIFADGSEDVLKKEITAYCTEHFPNLSIKEIEINSIQKGSYWKDADVTLIIDGALTVSQYDALYKEVHGATVTSQFYISPLEIIDDSGNDYESGYWDRQRAAATPAPTLSSQSNPGISEEDAKWAVYLMEEETIPKYLNCPSTMEMGLFRDCTIKDVGFDIWKGEGYFDAENLYGATVRSKWNITCTIKNGIIHVAKLKIDDIVVYNDGTQ